MVLYLKITPMDIFNFIPFESNNELHRTTLYSWRNSPEYRQFISNRQISLEKSTQTVLNYLKSGKWYDISFIEIDGVLAGFLFAYDFVATEQQTTITLYIAKEFRQNGIGKASGVLYTEYLMTKGVVRVLFEVQENNQASLLLMQSCELLEVKHPTGQRNMAGQTVGVKMFAATRDNVILLKKKFGLT